jgi:signal transduction histidine kinase
MIQLRKEYFTFIGLVLALSILVVMCYVTYIRTETFIVNSRWVEHTYTVLSQLDRTLSEIKDAETGQRGYLLTRNEKFLSPYYKAENNLPSALEKLQKLTHDNPNQADTVRRFSELAMDRMDYLKATIESQKHKPWKDDPELFRMLEYGKLSMDEIRNHVNNLSMVEEGLLAQRLNLAEESGRSTKILIIVGNFSAILLLIASFWVIRQENKKRILAQEAAETIAAQLQVTNKELESFSYSVSHDLRSPLRAIDGYSRIFEEDYAEQLDDEGKRLLAVVRSSSQKMGRLIDDLLDFARSGRKPLELEQVDMEQLIHEVWEEQTSQWHSAHTPELIKHAILPVTADRALLKQVLTNLVSNAIKYSAKKEHPCVSIDAFHRHHDVVYAIADNGVGFDMQYYNKLFGVFQRLHSAEEFQGTGVGLAIVQRIISRHGGAVWAKSELNEGSTFSFSLPMRGIRV